jgi:hypothetical protein
MSWVSTGPLAFSGIGSQMRVQNIGDVVFYPAHSYVARIAKKELYSIIRRTLKMALEPK